MEAYCNPKERKKKYQHRKNDVISEMTLLRKKNF